MKKFTVLVALALLAATGTGYAVTCAQDNVPAATLLIPYFKVGRGGITSAANEIPAGGVDTMIAVTNVSTINLIAHVTVWNKYSWGVLDFNIPMTGYDVVTFRMRDILNGRLNANMLTQDPAVFAGRNDAGALKDLCYSVEMIGGVLTPTTNFPPLLGNPSFRPPWPFVYNTPFLRFPNPNSADAGNAISSYNVPAFTGSFRNKVWDSLDEGRDYTSMTSRSQYIDVDNPSCLSNWASDQVLSGDFTGYVTIDVNNYCTNLFPTDSNYYIRDAIATVGWHNVASTWAYGPNVLMGDYFFVDPAASGGNISGDAAVAIEFDSRLDWFYDRTFYDRYWNPTDNFVLAGLQAPYSFPGDGREPLGLAYGFRYLNDAASGAQTWATVWRSDYSLYDAEGLYGPYSYRRDLCYWGYFWMLYYAGEDLDPRAYVYGFDGGAISATLWDEDEHSLVASGGGPSGDPASSTSFYVYLESQRIRVGSITSMNPQNYKFGWTRWIMPNTYGLGMAWVGVQHSAEGQFVSVGHNATLLVNDFTCPGDVFVQVGNNAVVQIN